MTDAAYQKFVARWEEVMELPPQRLGPFTGIYKRVIPSLKIMPWPLLVICALLVVGALYILIGSAITLLTTLLQRGF